jgi:hypothetical protein
MEGPLRKLKRAKHHFDDMRYRIGSCLEEDPFELRIGQAGLPARKTIYVHSKKGIPLILGDAINNLRSALDHICFAIWERVESVESLEKKKNGRGVAFPFCDTGEQLKERLDQTQMTAAPPAVVHEITALRPYRGGNKYLYEIQSLNNTDKHRTILLVGMGIRIRGSELKRLLAPLPVPENLTDEMLVETFGPFGFDIGANDASASFDIKADFQPNFTIGFGQGEVLENEAIESALSGMIQATDEAIRRLARAFFS